MNKTNQFSPKAEYVTPWGKCALIQFQGLVCLSPGFGDPGAAGAHGGLDDDTEEDY